MPGPNGAFEIRPREGFNPKTPQHEAGRAGAAASAAAAPPLEPPTVRVVSQGFRVAPVSSDSVKAVVPNSGVAVLPSTMKPAVFRRRTWAGSKAGTLAAKGREPKGGRGPAGEG